MPVNTVIPPSPPKPKRAESYKVGDRVTTQVKGVTFYERVIPAPTGMKNAKPFLIMETQVTQALYQAVIGKNPSCFKGDTLPVEQVSWEDCIVFCNKLSEIVGLQPAYQGTDNQCTLIQGANGFRLPFEAEWEFAAKGGKNYKYSGSDNLDEVGWYDGNSKTGGFFSGKSTHPVGQKKVNGYGLYDCSGNVWEWCADDYNVPGQHRSGASRRACRGGSWYYYADDCTVSYRDFNGPGYRDFNLGVRVSRSLE